MKNILQALEKDDVQSLRSVIPKSFAATSHVKISNWTSISVLSHQPPLIAVAVYYGSIECFKYLLSNGAKLTAED